MNNPIMGFIWLTKKPGKNLFLARASEIVTMHREQHGTELTFTHVTFSNGTEGDFEELFDEIICQLTKSHIEK